MIPINGTTHEISDIDMDSDNIILLRNTTS